MAENPFDPNRQPPTPPQDLAQNPEQSRLIDSDEDEEERRRAGRGSGGINPANASHSFNIRPDVGEGPAGLETYTTMKSADYRANPDPERDVTDFERQPTRRSQRAAARAFPGSRDGDRRRHVTAACR